MSTKPTAKPQFADANPFGEDEVPEIAPAPTPVAAPMAAPAPQKPARKIRSKHSNHPHYAGKRAITGYIDDATYKSLSFFREETGLSMVQMVDEAIGDYLEKLRTRARFQQPLIDE